MKSVDIKETDDRCNTAEYTDNQDENHGPLVSNGHVGSANDQYRKRHEYPVGQSIHDSMKVVHRPESAPGYAFSLHFVEEVLGRIAALEHSNKEEAECV